MDAPLSNALTRPSPPRTLSARRVAPAFAAVLVVGAAIVGIDLLLVQAAGRSRSVTAFRLYEKGIAATKAGNNAQAVSFFRAAHNSSPENTQYQLAFAQALRAVGNLRRADAELDELLDARPALGAANLERARSLSERGDWQQAAWYYHRAIYGEWKQPPDLRALRFEVADLLARHGAREQLASEVLLLGREPSDPGEAEHLATLQLAARQWAAAEDTYRSLLQARADEPKLLAGLSQAELGNRKYALAERTIVKALDAGASDPQLKDDLALVRTVNALDPLARRLPATEKHRRAHELALRLVAALKRCAPADAEVAAAEAELGQHEKARDYLALADSDVDLFQTLWAARGRLCGNRVALPKELEILAHEVNR